MLRKTITGTILFLIFFYCQGQDELCVGRVSQKLSNAIDDCRPDNETITVCSGRGSCICGACVCDTRRDPKEKNYGKYCECDNYSCDLISGQICAGHGTCECGRCLCTNEWTGPDCACSTATWSCKDPQNSEVLCNVHGDCVCGKCSCRRDQHGYYFGKYCEKYRKYEIDPGTDFISVARN